jgi:hypothetical protein
MKKKLIFFSSICSLLIIGCNSNTGSKNQQALLAQDTTVKVILSIPDWALGVMLNNSSNANACQQLLDSLKKLRVFHVNLDTALLTNDSIGKYVLTRKINPCCPCVPGANYCCPCQPPSLLFASPSSMKASVSVQSNMLLSTKQPSKEGIDFFRAPNSVKAGDTLVIKGRGIAIPLKFVF